MTTGDQLADFAGRVLGDEFCLDCYKVELGLPDRKEAEKARANLIASGTFKLEPGQCKKCGKQGMAIKRTVNRALK
jgi:hypothetical protein